jgi:hypothetical protein
MGLWKVVRVKKTQDISWLEVLALQVLRLYKSGYKLFTFDVVGDEVIIRALKRKQRVDANA